MPDLLQGSLPESLVPPPGASRPLGKQTGGTVSRVGCLRGQHVVLGTHGREASSGEHRWLRPKADLKSPAWGQEEVTALFFKL